MIQYALLIFILSATRSVSSENLKAKFAMAKLPVPGYFSEPAYDGNDSIYLFGGRGDAGPVAKILRYDIASDSIEQVGKMPNVSYSGTAEWIENDRSIYHFGGWTSGVGYYNVLKFEPRTNTSTSVSKLPEEVFDSPFMTSFMQGNCSIVYLLLRTSANSDKSRLYVFDTSTDKFTSGSSTIEFYGYTSAVIKDHSFIFGTNSQVLRVDMVSLEMEVIGTGPLFSKFSNAVSDGINAYLIGGYEDGIMGDFLLQLNPVSNKWTSLEVEDFPYRNETRYKYGPSSIFVEKLNRIYYFGGLTRNTTSSVGTSRDRDDIWYIELSPPPAPIFSCLNKPNGMYPHPTNCSKFFWCDDGASTELDCPSPLLFDPLTGRCDIPDNVACEAACTGKPDGQYPHPHDCSMFIICEEEVLSFYQCPAPLLFDPILLKCNAPEVVNCSA